MATARTAIFEGLNDEQRRAAEAVRGPVAIIAGAGTGKTTTITHRIAHQVASGVCTPNAILAVTFTEKAAGELKARLASLGVSGVEARTFHAAALSQLGRLWTEHTGEPLPAVLDSKTPLIAPLANALPPPFRFQPRSELAGEIEWAKNRMISPDGYLDGIVRDEHQPPIRHDLMHRIFEGYERRKARLGRLDFEDMLGLAVRLFDGWPEAAEAVRGRFQAFTVDEYQDVSLLQQALLDRWLGDRDELCVVGDDYQTIYSFTGASAEHLLGFPARYPNATVVRLERNYRSSPQILTVANALASTMDGFAKTLRATEPNGPGPTARALADADSEVAFVLAEAGRLHGEGVAWSEMAVLYRINARSEPYEAAFAAAGVPFQVRDGAFLRRPGPRAALARLRGAASTPAVADAVAAVTDALGFAADDVPDADEELTRQADLGRLRSLAVEYEGAVGADASVAGFVAELAARFATEHQGRGVQLMTFHRAKGLEFQAVFLPRLLDGELPYRSRRAKADLAEERRLFYVGITRARRHLYLSWPREPRSAPSPFLESIGIAKESAAPTKRPPPTGDPGFQRLRAWRRRRAELDGVPAYVVFHDKTLAAIAQERPRSMDALSRIAGVGPAKLDRYGADVLALIGTQ